MSAARSVLVSALGLLLLSGCVGATKATSAGTAAPAGTALRGAPPATTESASVIALGRAVKSYGQALAATAPASVREGLKLTAPNSAAYRYLEHMASMSEVPAEALPTAPPLAALPVGEDGFKFCTIPSNDFSCNTYSDFTVNQDGKLVDFTIDKQPVGPRLTVVSGQPVTVGDVKFTLMSAYRSIASSVLVVSVKVESGAEAITTNPRQWSYRGPDGKQATAVDSSRATLVIARSHVIVGMNLGMAKTGGYLTLSGCPSNDCPNGSFSGVLKVG
ncbi:MAG: hypothetical protein ABI899_01770 [Actinomycetota bacterium]